MIALLACADDRAVANNNGRVGAAQGPVSFNVFFNKINCKKTLKAGLPSLEIIPTESDIESTHQSVTNSIAEKHKTHEYSLFIGGGHDYAYPHLKGVQQFFQSEIGCINIDPHFDLRKPNPDILSGSPFYIAIENNVIKGENLVEFGIGEHCNGAELWEYAQKNNVKTIPFHQMRNENKIDFFRKALKKLSNRVDHIVISLDLDAIQAAYAPGVSAPAAEGFTPSEILEMIKISAQNKKVCSLGIFELNPKYDIDNRTARLAALAAFEFIRNKMD